MSTFLVLIVGLTRTDTSDFSLSSLDGEEISVPWLNLGLHNGQLQIMSQLALKIESHYNWGLWKDTIELQE